MSRSLNDLCECIRPEAGELLRRAHEDLGFTMIVVDTLRTPAEQQQNIIKRVSFTAQSKHIAQPICGKSHAIDAVPHHLAILKNWAPEHPDWLKLGELGESLGLKWGGRWAGIFHRKGDPTSRQPDCPHFDKSISHESQTRLA